MKKKSCVVVAVVSILGFCCGLHVDALEGKAAMTGNISISGAWALYPIVVKWAEEFQKENPEVKIDVAAGGAGKGVTDALAGMVDFGMVSRDINPAEVEKGAWWVSVTKDAVVPVVNAKNPILKELMMQGVNKEKFAGIWITGSVESWEEALKITGKYPVHVYTRSDACGAAETWSKYLGKKQEDLLGTGVYGDPGLADAVNNDELGIGYNNINFVYDSKTKKQVDGLRVLPIDLNGNGQVDKSENFYGSLDEIVSAINTGDYPSPPARNLHLVSKGVPTNPAAVAFLKWILTEGQKYVSESGYIKLPDDVLAKELAKLGVK